MSSTTPRRVAVVRFSSVGDIVLTAPALHAFKRAFPETELVFVTKAAMRPLVAYNPHVDSLVYHGGSDTLRSVAEQIRNLEVDALVDLHGNLRSRGLRFLLRGIPSVVWKKRPVADSVPVRLGLRPYHAKMPISDRYHQAMELLVGEPLRRGELRYVVGHDDQREADVAIERAGIDRGRSLVGLSPGAKWATKCWPIERFVELARRIQQSGWQTVITGSAEEAALGEAIVDQVPTATSLVGELSLGALGGVIARCAAFVANDSGPMHISRALGVPTVAFFGTTDPRQFEFDGHALMYADTSCSPCHFYGRSRCPKGHFSCMLDLSVDDAWSALAARVGTGPLPLVHG